MKKLKVNDKNYALFEYTPFLDRNCNEIKRPKNTKYDLGDVVYIKEQNSIGVVLGCIDNECGELRTDMDGMQAFDNIEPATMKHFELPDVRFVDRLKEDLLAKDEDKKIIGGITHIKDNTFNRFESKQIKKKHPLGECYERDRMGYVANGYDWWKFPIDRLEFINKNH